MIKYTVKPAADKTCERLCDVTGKKVTGRKDTCVKTKAQSL